MTPLPEKKFSQFITGLFSSHGKSCESDITLVRDLLGHADLKTTEIYLSAVGREKRNIVLKAWD